MNTHSESSETDVDQLCAQLDELAETQSRSRAQELRHQIEQEIAALLEPDEEETLATSGTAGNLAP